MAKILLALCFVMAMFLELSAATSARQQIPLSKTVLDFEPLRMHQLRKTGDDINGHALHVKFQAFDQDFDLTLFHSPTFSSESVVVELTSKGSDIVRPTQESLSFRARDHSMALTLDHTKKDIVRGVIEQGSDTFHIITVEEAHESMVVFDHSTKMLKESGAKMIIFRDLDVISDPENPQLCAVGNPSTDMNDQGNATEYEQEPTIHFGMNRARRDLSIFPPPSPCPSEPLNLNMSFAADSSYLDRLERAGLTFESWLDTNINIISAVHLKTFHTTITVTNIIKAKENDFPSWNSKGCGQSISDKLNKFSYFRGKSPVAKNRPEGLFHLLSGCYQRGTIGLAWLSVLCLKSAQRMNNGGYYSGTAVSSGSGLGWLTVAHEMGHQFGSPHNNERNPKGIMYPYHNPSKIFLRTTQRSACSHMAKRTSCFNKASQCTPKCPNNCGKYGCCGDDGCGGTCGAPCGPNGKCTSNVCTCIPNCNGRQCGDDGCGGQCGQCKKEQMCISSKCIDKADPSNKYIALHNNARSLYDLRPVTWSSKLATFAEEFVKKCTSVPSIHEGIGYNFARVSWKNTLMEEEDSMVQTIIENWVNVKEKWNCKTDECQPDGNCRVFTQMVHEKVTEIGCAYSYCSRKEEHHLACYYDYNGKYVTSKPFPESFCPLRLLNEKCQPKDSCASTEKECGFHFDGCNKKDCGTCGNGAKCENHKCKCVATTSCEAQHKTCGVIDVGCGIMEDCGKCGGTTPCVNNRCSPCVPITSCEEQGRTCGFVNNGCELVRCGACQEGHGCEEGVCTSCSNCHEFATCTDTGCQCRPGYMGNGIECDVRKDISDFGVQKSEKDDISGSHHNTYTHLSGYENVWELHYNSVKHTASTNGNSDMLLLNENMPFSLNSVTSTKILIKKLEGAMRVGVILYLKDSKTIFRVYWDASDNKFKLDYAHDGTFQKLANIFDDIPWGDGVLKTVEVEIVGNAGISIKLENQKRSFEFVDMEDIHRSEFTHIGVYAQGAAEFHIGSSSSYSKVSVTLAQCFSEEELRSRISSLLEIDPTQIKDILVITPCFNRRDASAAISPVVHSFTLSGSSSASSAALASAITAQVAQQSTSLALAGVVATSASISAPTVNAGAIALSLGTATAISTASIAAIVGGTVALVGAATAGGVYIKKRHNSSSTLQSESVEDAPKEKPLFGVNVMNPDPQLTRTFSLTQRNFTGFADSTKKMTEAAHVETTQTTLE